MKDDYLLNCAITAEDKAERRKILLFEYTVPGFLEEGTAQVIIDEHLCEWTEKQGYHGHSMPVFTNDDSQVRDLCKDAGAEIIKLTLTDVPTPVLRALIAVRKRMPAVTMVTYSPAGKWRYTDSDFQAPAFGHSPDLSTAILEDAADHIANTCGFPAVYALPKWAIERCGEVNPNETC